MGIELVHIANYCIFLGVAYPNDLVFFLKLGVEFICRKCFFLSGLIITFLTFFINIIFIIESCLSVLAVAVNNMMNAFGKSGNKSSPIF